MRKIVVKYAFVLSFIVLFLFLIFSIVGLGSTAISTVELDTKAKDVDVDQSWTFKTRDFQIEEGEGATEVTVLLYHRIIEDNQLKDCHYENGELISTILPASQFDEQLQYLKNNDYTILTSLELEKFIDKELEVPKNSVVLTFDDSRKEDYEVTYGILKKYGFTAVDFVITGEVTRFTNSYDSEECLYMSQAELEKSTDVFEFQSHTHDMHKEDEPLLHSSKETIIKDLKESYAFLHTSRRLLAYPFSAYNDTAKEAAKEVGVSMAFIIDESRVNHNTDKFEVPRYSITPDIDLEDFIYLVEE